MELLLVGSNSCGGLDALLLSPERFTDVGMKIVQRIHPCHCPPESTRAAAGAAAVAAGIVDAMTVDDIFQKDAIC